MARKKFQFTLASALILMMLIGSLACVVLQNSPWTYNLEIQIPQGPCNFTISPDTKFLAVVSWANTSTAARVFISDLSTGRAAQMLTCDNTNFYDSCFSPDSCLLAVATDHAVQLWNWRNNQLMISCTHPGAVSSVRFSSDGNRFITGCDDGKVRIWDKSGGLVKELTGTLNQSARYRPAYSVEFSQDGDQILAVCTAASSSIVVWDARSFEERLRLKDQERNMFVGACFLENDCIGFIWGNKICSFDLNSQRQKWRLEGGKLFPLDSISYSRSSNRVVTSSGDRTIRIFDAQAGEELAILNRNISKGPIRNNGLTCAIFLTDGRIASTQMDEPLVIWKRRFPEQWWGQLCRPEVWMTFFLFLLWIFCNRILFKPRPVQKR